jgi:methylated-DNA-[protein]-cysteine S-methyltransferase
MPLPAREPGFTGADPVYRLTVASPVGALTLFEQSGAITHLLWAASNRLRNARPTPLLAAARVQLDDYFAGKLDRFHLPLAPAGTGFQRRVWDALRKIPAGRTLTYGELARRLGSGPRAVGAACGANPIPILIPCHRVLAAGGRLNGYSGQGGIVTKKRLLDLEGALEGHRASG